MESRSPPEARGQRAEIVVGGPDGGTLGHVALAGRERVTVGRLPELNDLALQPDPQQLVTRASHCTLEREGERWSVVDGGSVNGTYLRRASGLERVEDRATLRDGDAVCVLGAVDEAAGERRWFELVFQSAPDPQATRAAPLPAPSPAAAGAEGCLSYDAGAARLVLVQGSERHEIEIRAQAHRLVRYMAERNAAGGEPALCTHEELMQAVWGEEPLHNRVELARLVWELRRKLEPFGAGQLIENRRRLGYRLRTCPTP